MKKILIAENDENTVLTLKMALETEYFEVITAFNGIEAISMARKELPDLIILDILMPGINGIIVNKRLKQDKNTMNIPVIVITAKEEARELLKESGAKIDAYFDKPVGVEVLLEEMNRILG